MNNYTLEPIDFAIACAHDNEWWLQEVSHAHKIISTDIPAWIDIVVHYGVTERRTVSPFWTVSDYKTGSMICVDLKCDRDKVVQQAIKHISARTEEEYDAKVQELLDLRANRRRIRKRRLKK